MKVFNPLRSAIVLSGIAVLVASGTALMATQIPPPMATSNSPT